MSADDIQEQPLQTHVHDEVNQWIMQMAVEQFQAQEPVIATTPGSDEPFVVDATGRFWRIRLHPV